MNFELVKATLTQAKGDIVVVGVYKGEDAGKALKSLDAKLPKALEDGIKKHLESEGFKGKVSEIVCLPTFGHIDCPKLMIVGLGSKEEFNPNIIRKTSASVARKVKGHGGTAKVIMILPHEVKATKARSGKSPAKATIDGGALAKAAVEGWILGKFEFDKYKSQKDKSDQPTGKRAASVKKGDISLALTGITIDTKAFQKAVKEATAVAEATIFARALVDEPPVYMTPTRLSIEAKDIAKDHGLTCTVLSTPQIEKLGMGCFLGVARGADEPPKFIVMKYTAPKAKKTVAIIGKGITFDSGGLSLKPAQSMERMKYDMSGAACVLGVMRVVGALKPNVSVLAVVAATENMPSGKALHPGDVITAMNGKTVEVNNTDAEGRLVLADALTYAIGQKADELIDVATLTGAVVTALGRAAAGIMGTNQDLIEKIMQAGQDSGERFWQLPLFDEYKQALHSDVADLMNAGSRGEAGSSCGGMFLKEFVENKPWAHLDIAGVAWSEKNKDELNKGGTGFGVRTLSRYLMSH